MLRSNTKLTFKGTKKLSRLARRAVPVKILKHANAFVNVSAYFNSTIGTFKE
jgi:predicted transcriptional regulator